MCMHGGSFYIHVPSSYREEDNMAIMDMVFAAVAVVAVLGIAWYTKKHGR